MNPRKKFKPRNSNSSSENEMSSGSSADRRQPKSSPAKNSPSKQHQHQRPTECQKNSPNKNRGSPQKAAKRQLHYTPPHSNTQHQQPIENRVFEAKTRRSPNKNTPPPPPTAPVEEDFASPKLSFSSPNAADVPLPPTHWFSTGCGRQYQSMNSNITNQLKTLLNVV